MGRIPCCEKDNVKRGQWTPEEDNKLSSYIALHGTRNWRLIPKNAGLQRCGKSCRLRWTNYLRPDLKHGEFSESEEQTIVKLHSVVGNRSASTPHYKLQRGANSSGYEASPPPVTNSLALRVPGKPDYEDDTIHQNKLGLPRALQEPEIPLADKPWSLCSNEETSDGFTGICNTLPSLGSGFQYGASSYANEGDASPWNQSMCTGSTCTGGDQKGVILGKDDEEDGEVAVGGKHGAARSSSLFNPDSALWDLSDF
ncbi:hypothetical protein H6P81_008766 [Aristolochia fimbriata]|uniref:Uncharacterized protein n=1 Tax=Aristolochia fimbriata TaxID=158543 RepID=A0AAV7EMA2_ARIFI|nr:hypothetical protein H6P81_008766 [Aristolochia fimbriata]